MSGKGYSQEIDFLRKSSWDELYILTKHWKSDIEFYRDDLHFLHHLTDKYFMWIIKQENIDMVRALKIELQVMNTRVKGLLKNISEHNIRLGYLVENPKYADEGVIKKDHEHLEEEMAAFIKSFRKNRKEIFKITECMIDSEELANLM